MLAKILQEGDGWKKPKVCIKNDEFCIENDGFRKVAAERPAAFHPRHPAARAGAHGAAQRAVGGALPAVDGDYADPAR